MTSTGSVQTSQAYSATAHSAHAHSAPAQSSLYDAVIVGAGPAGSSLASSLAGSGWRVLLVEREHFPRHKVCGEFLSPEAQETLAALGLYESVAALGAVPLDGATLTTAGASGRGRTVQVNMPRPDSSLPTGNPARAWGISRYALDAALAAAAVQRGADLWSGTTVTGCGSAPCCAVGCRSRNGISTVQARAVVMACGWHGLANLLPPPKALPGSRRATRRKQSVGIKCHFAGVSMPAQVELYLFAGGYVGINPIENGRANVCALASYSAFARAGASGTRSPGALIEAAARWNPAFGKRLLGAQAVPDTECAVAPVDTRRPRRPWWDGLPRLGDTAAMIPPLCGDGMAMALRSAQLCAPLVDGYLRSVFSWREVEQRYSRLWHGEFDRRLQVGRLLETMLLQPVIADLLIGFGQRFPPLVDYLVRATRGAGSSDAPAR